MRRCCNRGCDGQGVTLRDIDEGYRVGFGFMLWACPKHAAIWKRFDEENRQYDHKYNVAFPVAYEEFEEGWCRKFKLENPPPIPPKYQASTDDDNESFTNIEFGCVICGELECGCEPEPQPNPYAVYRIRRRQNNLVIQELKGDPAKENWEIVSYHGNNLSSLISGVSDLIAAQHTPTDDKLTDALEKLRLALVSSVDQIEKMIRRRMW